MINKTPLKFIYHFIFLIALAIASNAYARSGIYAGLDLGAGFVNDMDTQGGANDSPTNCDQLLPAAGAGAGNVLSENDPLCTNPKHTTWKNESEWEPGILVGANLGYGWNNLRFEAEYAYHQNSGSEQYTKIAVAGGKLPEFSDASEKFDNLGGHQFFANLYYDLTELSSVWIPYVGAGVGFMQAQMQYNNRFIRKTVAGGFPPGINENAAGTASLSSTTLEDTLFGYQFIGGLDYKLQENIFIGVKFRYALFEDFNDDDTFDILRSHAPLKNDGTPLEYDVTVDDFDFWSTSINLKYFF